MPAPTRALLPLALACVVAMTACPAGAPAGELGANDPCNDTTVCGAGLQCVGGFCKVAAGGACGADRACAATLLCEEGVCRVPGGGDCTGELPCITAHRCEESVCRAEISQACGDSLPCRAGLACSNGFCKVAAGGTCSGDGECVAGTRCDEGICRAPIGGTCGEAVACASGSTCVNGVCRVPKGGDCAEPGDCAPGLTCEENACVVPVGGVCASTDDCEAGLACDDDSTCRVPKLGDCTVTDDCAGLLACSAQQCRVEVLGRCAEGDCAAGLDCIGGTCVARPGADCPTGFECGPLLTCDDGVCRGDQGAPCEAGECAQGLTCVEGTCVGDVGSACSREADCLEALVCDGGLCKVDLNGTCNGDRPCATGFVCSEGVCRVPAQGLCAGDVCAAGLVCEGGFCRVPSGGACGPSQPCTAGFVCSEGVCRRGPGQTCASSAECAVGLSCIGGLCSRPVGGSCGPGVPCAVGLTCVEGQCRATVGSGCVASDECATGLVCNTGVCEAPRGGPCDLTRDCADGLVCVYGTCVGGVGSPCAATTECNLSLQCVDDVCLGGEGATCSDDEQCADGLRCIRQACAPPAPPLPPTTSVQIRADATIRGATGDELARTYASGWGNVIAVADFDGDAVADVAVGAPSAGLGGTNKGRVAIVFGEQNQAPGRVTDLPAYTSTDPLPSHVAILEGVTTDDRVGAALAATDFNGDGVMDLAVGMPGWDESGTSNTGQVAIFYGGGAFPRGNKTLLNAAYFSTTSFVGVRIVGGYSGARLGNSLAAGDANGDRIGDVFVGGSKGDASMSSDYGSAHLFIGTNNATTMPVRSVVPQNQARVLVYATGNTAVGNQLGSSLALGDADGDGYDDLFVVWERANATVDGTSRWGAVFMIRGRPTSALGQVVELGGGSSFDWANDPGAAAVEFVWFGGDTSRGDNQVLAADVTGDGRAEVFFSYPDGTSSNLWTDAVFVLKGRTDFASAIRSSKGKVFSVAKTGEGSAPIGYDWMIKGRQYDAFGFRLAAADVTADRVKDLVIAAPVSLGSGSSSRPGSLSLFVGGATLLPSAPTITDLTVTPPPVRIDNAGNSRAFGRALALGDVNGDGASDIAAGAQTMSGTGTSTNGQVSVVFGGPVLP